MIVQSGNCSFIFVIAASIELARYEMFCFAHDITNKLSHARVKATYNILRLSTIVCEYSSIYCDSKMVFIILFLELYIGKIGICENGASGVLKSIVASCLSFQSQNGMITCLYSRPLHLWIVMRVIPSSCSVDMVVLYKSSSH